MGGGWKKWVKEVGDTGFQLWSKSWELWYSVNGIAVVSYGDGDNCGEHGTT